MRNKLKDVMRKLGNAGVPTYVVGGAVRDKLLGLPVKDYDLATPLSLKELVGKSGAVPVASRSGAPVAILDGFEIASFRKDSGDSRHGTTFEPATILEDAFRRDFTVNALYEDSNGILWDPTEQGEADLEMMLLRFCGDPMKRIQEDPLRVLRGYRLAAQKGFSFELKTWEAFKSSETRELLKTVAQEQIGRELAKLLSIEDGRAVALELRYMADDGILEVILPEVFAMRGVDQNKHHQEGDVFEHTMWVLEKTPNDLNLRFAALFHDIGKPATQALKLKK